MKNVNFIIISKMLSYYNISTLNLHLQCYIENIFGLILISPLTRKVLIKLY